jgi:hypothetical protein
MNIHELEQLRLYDDAQRPRGVLGRPSRDAEPLSFGLRWTSDLPSYFDAATGLGVESGVEANLGTFAEKTPFIEMP